MRTTRHGKGASERPFAGERAVAPARQVRSRMARALYFVVLFVVVNGIVSLAVGQYASLSSVAWSDFRAATDPGTVFVGSSFAQRAFDPIAFDDELVRIEASDGRLSYNLATPGQTLPLTADSVDAAIEAGARRIVLGLGLETFRSVEDARAQVAYVQARHEGDPLALALSLAQVAVQPSVMGTKDSLNVIFPWVYTPVRSPRGLVSNVRSRLSGEERGPAAERVTPDWHYVGRGYGNYGQVLRADDPATSASTYGVPVPDERAFRVLEEICVACREAGVELVVVSAPHPAYDIASQGEAYPAAMARVGTVCAEQGASFLDFNQAQGGALALGTEDYCDFEHLGLEGARTFSAALARTLSGADGMGGAGRANVE